MRHAPSLKQTRQTRAECSLRERALTGSGKTQKDVDGAQHSNPSRCSIESFVRHRPRRINVAYRHLLKTFFRSLLMVDAAISEKVRARRHELEAEMSKLDGYTGGGRRGRPVGRGGPRGAVAPKYRNPENSAETRAGRGLKPRWWVAAMKGGKKLEHFAIAGAAEGAGAKKVRKKRKS
jgi:hypothetical protein